MIQRILARIDRLVESIEYAIGRRIPFLSAERKPLSVSTKAVWSLGYALHADVTPFAKGIPSEYSTVPRLPCTDPRAYVGQPLPGQVVWVSEGQVKGFVEHVLPQLKNPIRLVITDGDDSFPSQLPESCRRRILDDPRILAVFAQNVDGTAENPKVHPIPIGLDFHTQNSRNGGFGEPQSTSTEQEARLTEIWANALPFHARDSKVFADFALSDRVLWDGSRRSQIIQILDQQVPLTVPEKHLPRTELWKRKSKVQFSVSPHGNGLDCHRTWEDLWLGCIVIVKHSPLDPLYQGLAVAIVQDWGDVTAAALERWRRALGPLTADPQARHRLTMEYWANQVRK